MIFFKKSSLTNTFGNNWLKLQTNAWKIKKKKNAMQNESSRAISQLNDCGSFLESQLRAPASKSSIATLHSDIIWLFF